MSSAFPRWGDAYRFGDFPDYHKALKLNESFSQLLDKPVASSHYVTLSLDGITKLETCVRGFVEVQLFSLWSIATMFEFLKDSNCVPEDSVFRQLISMTRGPHHPGENYLLPSGVSAADQARIVCLSPPWFYSPIGEEHLAFDSFL